MATLPLSHNHVLSPSPLEAVTPKDRALIPKYTSNIDRARPSALEMTGSVLPPKVAMVKANDTFSGVEHLPVMRDEVLSAMSVVAGAQYIDGTIGLGGHAEAILQAGRPDARLLGVDADPEAVARSRERLFPFGDRARVVQANFRDIGSIAQAHGFSPVDGILLDLGVSSLHLSAQGRGFSFQHEAPLDMRMDPSIERTAAHLVNESSEAALTAMLQEWGEEPMARRIARAIVRRRPLATTTDLARVVTDAVGRGKSRIHPATRTFQALRIAVNSELDSLSAALAASLTVLGSGGRLVIISFHSLEDRIVKTFLRHESQNCICPPSLPVCACNHRASLRIPRGSSVKPSQAEILSNPRSRSARLRIAVRL